ncbi:MAG: L-serine ammonia-lyase [Geminicoccaceae bacterium]|nr:L-serine ammonia-lyase [Geminicoccaceae bacterium]
MPLSVFDLFKIGIGPSSSHTVGPMWAANRFLLSLDSRGLIEKTVRVRTLLYGSLALTGLGHATDKAVILGLAGEVPDRIDADAADARLAAIRTSRRIDLSGRHGIDFDEARDLQFRTEQTMTQHPNGMRFIAYDAERERILEEVYFSVGGGFVMSEEEAAAESGVDDGNIALPHPFSSATELLTTCAAEKISIAELVRRNELAMRSPGELDQGLADLWSVMEGCIERGCRETGLLPGALKVRRRAKRMHDELCSRPEAALRDTLTVLDWVNLYALAVNEENAAGGRVVTAPTNGAAGVIPAILAYYMRFVPGASEDGRNRFLLTAAAIGMLYKQNASISAAEVGCQGEVGVACSMAAGALCAVLGGTNEQVENAAEIGMEHNLGLTCDPIGGLVQIPCIERNTMGAIKAINAARLALRGDGTHFVSLDSVIDTMRETGRDMSHKYKETSLGGLAVNIVEC